MIEISASSEVIEQLINEEKRDIEGINRAESIKQVQQFILDKQTTGLDDAKINAVNKRHSIISVVAKATLIAMFIVGVVLKHNSAIGLAYEIVCLVILSVYYVLFVSRDRKRIKDVYDKTNRAVSFELVNRADEVMRALVENRACTIAEAEALVISDDNKSKELKNI